MTRADYLHAELWELTEQQDGVLSRAQLLHHHLTVRAIDHRIATGRLWPIYRGVYAVGRKQLSREGRWRAALLAGGETAALSWTSAGRCWESCDESVRATPHISVLTRSRKGQQPDLHLHRCPTLTEDDVTEYRGFRVTTLPQTHVDLTQALDVRAQRAALRESEFRHQLDLGDLRRTLDGLRRSKPRDSLCALLDEWVPGIGLTDSELEARFLELCHAAGITAPEVQVKVYGYRVDFVWRDVRLIVETDGYEAHRGRIAFQRDRARDRKLQARGYSVLRFTWAEVVGQPQRVVAELLAARRRRSRELAR